MENVQNLFRLPALRINLLLSPPVFTETEDSSESLLRI